MQGDRRREYGRVVRHFRRTRGVVRCSDREAEGDGRGWRKLAHQGHEAVVYVDRGLTRVKKKFVVSLEEDPIARFEAMELVNAAASDRGVSPRVHRMHYELSDLGVLSFCVESDYFDGSTFDELRDASKRRAAPAVRALAARMVRLGIWHGDLHGGNVMVSPDLSRVAFVDFGHGCFLAGRPSGARATEAMTALALRKLDPWCRVRS